MERKNPEEIEKKDIEEVEKQEEEEEEATAQEQHDQTIANPPAFWLLPASPQSHDHPNSKRPPLPLDSPPDTSQPKNPPSPPLDAIKVFDSRGPDTHRQVEESERKPRPSRSIRRRSETDILVKRALLGFRILGFLFSMVSLSVMAADRDQGWAIDSFYRYKEFRYCFSVTVIAFVYLGVQAFVLAYSLSTGNHRTRTQLRQYLDFSIDQMLAYLLISSSSSAAVRVDDWQSNWGKDKFPEMATASVAFSFLTFAALAFCSLVSGYITLETM